MNSVPIPEYIDGLSNICGSEELIAEVMVQEKPYLPESGINFDQIRSAFAYRCIARKDQIVHEI